MNSFNLRTEEALTRLSWVRALAHSLARDANAAEDVVQDAFLLSLERPPRDASRLGPWLAKVTRTLARQQVRSSRSRRERENVVARESREAGGAEPFEVLERGHRQRLVADAVLSLPEPYASTVLYHYLDGLSAAKVGERMGCEAATVRKRLERGRALLRERLDKEFGCETENWALGLLLPLATPRIPTAATGAMGASAKAIVVGGLMGSKLIGLVGIVLACGLFLLARDPAVEVPAGNVDFSSVVPGEGPAQPNLQERPQIPELQQESARANLLPELSLSAPAAVPLAQEVDDGVVLLVRGVDSDGNPVMSGLVDCYWGLKDRVNGSGSGQLHVRAEITSAITRVELPGDARSARVCVSHARFAPSPGVLLGKLRTDSSGTQIDGQIVHEVDVPLVSPTTGPLVYGDIFLDGHKHCPAGLRVFLNGQGQAWINTITASYRLGPVRENPGSLLVVSDYSLPTFLELDSDSREDQRIDLMLESGRELIIHAVDATTGALAVGREITIYASNPVKKTMFKTYAHGHGQSAVVDAGGDCRFKGIPIDGQVAIMQRLDDGVGQNVLEHLFLDSSMPSVVQCEVQLVSTAPVLTRVFGTLPTGAGAGVQGVREIKLTSRSGGGRKTVSVDSDGKWSVELSSHSMWGAQAMLDGLQRSEEKLLQLKGEAEHGPVQLGWQGALSLTLLLVDVPQTGRIEIECTEREGGAQQRLHLEAKGEDLEQELLLSGPADVVVVVIPAGGDSEFGLRHRFEVHPRTERTHVVELGASQGLELSFQVEGEFPAGEGSLILVSPGTSKRDAPRVLFPLLDGVTIEAQPIDPGRWLYVLVKHEKYPGLVMGWVDVPERPNGVLKIDWHGAPKPVTELGSAIKVLTVDGLDLQEWIPAMGPLPWSADLLKQDALWIPTNITYEVVQ